MGQCSTLPAETRHSPSGHVAQPAFSPVSSMQREDKKKQRLSEGGRRGSMDFNGISPQPRVAHGTVSQFRVQSREAERQSNGDDNEDNMDIDTRDEAPIMISALPEGAVKTRCYKLNLNSEIVHETSPTKQQTCLGPFSEPPPFLTYSSSEDSYQDVDMTEVAIKTAQIFRGITVGRDGTILSQNARATRSNRGAKTKRGEKSRQAAKIDKANDLVEEAVMNALETDEPVNMVSLIIVGEYDDMKQLVRDGSKKLRDAEGLPDEALLAINRPRPGSLVSKNRSKVSASSNSSRKRNSVSPNYVNGQRTAAMQSLDNEQITVSPHPLSPPKLKSHPRDTRPARREYRANMRMRLEACSDFMDPRHSSMPGNNDWSQAWNIWNCVGSGAVSPLQQTAPNENFMVFEGRDASYGTAREGGVTGRAN